MKSLIKQPLFLIGFIFVVGLVVASFYYQVKYHNDVPQKHLFYDESGKLIGAPPLSPSKFPPFGTDRAGRDMGRLLLIGAKWTLGGAILIAFVRMVISFFIGILYGNYFYRFKKFFTTIIDGITTIPLTIFAFVVLNSVLNINMMTSEFPYPLWQRVTFEGLFLALISVPVVSVVIGNDIGEVYKNEYISCARVLGGSRWHLFWRHIMPHILPRLFVQFVQQIIQVLIIMGHLGLLGLFFGGTIRFMRSDLVLSSTQEWAGLIGMKAYNSPIGMYTWLIVEPIIMFTLSIIALNFILVGIQKAIKANTVAKIKKGLHQNKEEIYAYEDAAPFTKVTDLKKVAN